MSSIEQSHDPNEEGSKIGSLYTALKESIGIENSQSNILGIAFVLPNLVVFGLFLLFPVIFAIYISFHSWSIISDTGQWIGLENYISILTPLPWENNWAPIRSPDANLWWYSLKNTFVYSIGTIPLSVFGGLFVSMMLNKNIKGKKTLRAMYFSPILLSGVVAGVIWRWILEDRGILNYFLRPWGLDHAWAGDSATALFGVVVIGVWAGVGFNMIIYLAGLQNIPDELYEAISLNGANRWQRFRYVTWPSLSDITYFVIILAVIQSFQVFTYAMVFASGGPYFATTTAVVLIYKNAFVSGDLGIASAMSVLLFMLLFIFSYYQYRLRDQQSV